jgi:soluble lytic murein transglycosylase-like protein
MKASHTDSISAGLGLAWLAIALGLVYVLAQGAALPERPDPAAQGGATAPSRVAAAPLQQPVPAAVVEQEQKALAEYIAKRWRIAEEAASRFVSIAYRAGGVHSVDPVLILAVMAIESGYNPVAQSVMGAKGLMQVIPRFHLEKLDDHGGEEALLDPEVNILVGAQILREYHRRLRDEELALQMYGGAFDEPTAQYANKVFAERARLEPIRRKARQQTAQSV